VPANSQINGHTDLTRGRKGGLRRMRTSILRSDQPKSAYSRLGYASSPHCALGLRQLCLQVCTHRSLINNAE
jgi:hypothetical protein